MVSCLAACGDLIAAVFDFAHGMCALKLTEQQIALFSALVLINAGKPSSVCLTRTAFILSTSGRKRSFLFSSSMMAAHGAVLGSAFMCSFGILPVPVGTLS